MAADRPSILADINEEREYQDNRWGTEFDDKNTVNDFVTYITKYAGNAAFEGRHSGDACDPAERTAHQRTQLAKVAALAVAAIETIDRNGGLTPRHYDNA